MKFSAVLLSASLAFATPGAVFASDDDRPDHFEGEPSKTLEQAVRNFSEYNQKLAGMLQQQNLSAEDIYKIHNLTYTLENALHKIEDEVEELEEVLEEVHKASERADGDTVSTRGKVYLEKAQTLIK
jgi:septal ring factor EnvC (AmiA/AmiB activator)